jgi:hypothetical protein
VKSAGFKFLLGQTGIARKMIKPSKYLLNLSVSDFAQGKPIKVISALGYAKRNGFYSRYRAKHIA